MNPNRPWYVCLQDEVVGPIPESALYTFIRNQRLSGHDHVWREGLTLWVRLCETPEFGSLFAKMPRAMPPLRAATTTAPKSDPRSVPSVPARGEPVINRPSRVPIEGSVRFDNGEHHRLVNISESGCLVAIPQNVPLIGKEVKFHLEAPAFGRSLELTGVLVREDFSTAENAVAIEFTRLNPAYRRLIREYVQQRETKKAA